MNWLPDPYVTILFILFFAFGFENSRYILAIRQGQTELGEFGTKFIAFTSYAHIALMILFLALHWYDYGLVKTIILFGFTIFLIAPLLSGILITKLELFFREALWGISSLLIYPTAYWLMSGMSWFGHR